jgi:hypothetical protein
MHTPRKHKGERKYNGLLQSTNSPVIRAKSKKHHSEKPGNPAKKGCQY